jgi:hypothetical protein
MIHSWWRCVISLARGLGEGRGGLPRATSYRPWAELLEHRLVPAAAPLDLTTPGAIGAVNGAIFEQANPQPTGVGVINDFLRIQSHGQQAVEQGFNTDARPVSLDDKGGSHTRSLQLSELPLVNINGVNYYVFLLGVNQDQANPLLSLDQLRIYVADAPNLTGYDPTTGQLAGLNPVYDLNASGGTNWVALDSSLSDGNGSGDMYLFVPSSSFASANPNPYVYLYSEFGMNYAANGGFEQWAPGIGAVAPPLPAPSSLSGFVFLATSSNGVPVPGEPPVPGTALTLTGMNSLGQAVNLTARTGADGSFMFNNLLPGTYVITETVPANFQPGSDTVGTVNGAPDGTQTSNTVLGNIMLEAGQFGINYNFGLLQPIGGGS